MFKKAISTIMAVPLAVAFCTAGNRGKEPSTDYISTRPAIVYHEQYRSKNLGNFYLSFYTPYEEGGKWGYKTATGVKSKHLQTCAVDPSVIPYGTTVRITGDNGKVLELLACDCGGLVKGKTIDIFFDGTQKEGYAFMEDFGQIHTVYVVKE